MTRGIATLLDTGDSFPDLDFTLVSGESVVVPQDLGKRWRILLIYRGHW